MYMTVYGDVWCVRVCVRVSLCVCMCVRVCVAVWHSFCMSVYMCKSVYVCEWKRLYVCVGVGVGLKHLSREPEAML